MLDQDKDGEKTWTSKNFLVTKSLEKTKEVT